MGIRAPGTQPGATTCDMGGWFLVILYLFISENWALECLPREYKHNDICCPMCDKGSFVKAHCTSGSSSSRCILCADNTYMDQPNSYTNCFRCKNCDSGAGLIVRDKCTTTSNTVCECQVGHYCLNQECDLCQEHTKCKPGEYIKKPGTERTDTECENCPAGHFSNETHSSVCSPWTKCSELGFVEFKKGNSTTDVICKEKRGHLWAILALLSPGIFAIFVSYNALYKPGKTQKQQEYPYSEQEEGIREAGSENRRSERT